jgi:hypothetical protein
MGLGDVLGPDARTQTELGVVRDRGDLIQIRTGPKISSRTTFMSGRVLVSTVGSTK